MKSILIWCLLISSFGMLQAQNRPEVPVLCYHHITVDGHDQNTMFISLARFKLQMKALHDSGYKSITPDDYLAYLQGKKSVAIRSVLISFDDARECQYLLAAPVLEQYGFRGVFYIMTVVINKKGYLNTKQIKDLSVRGHTIGAHTWNHPNLQKQKFIDEQLQLVKPRHTLEQITGKSVQSFAFPYGAWDERSLKLLDKYGYTTAFQLSMPRHPAKPHLTLRRIMVNGGWSPERLQKEMKSKFD